MCFFISLVAGLPSAIVSFIRRKVVINDVFTKCTYYLQSFLSLDPIQSSAMFPPIESPEKCNFIYYRNQYQGCALFFVVSPHVQQFEFSP